MRDEVRLQRIREVPERRGLVPKAQRRDAGHVLKSLRSAIPPLARLCAGCLGVHLSVPVESLSEPCALVAPGVLPRTNADIEHVLITEERVAASEFLLRDRPDEPPGIG